jgi:hypothetical protein
MGTSLVGFALLALSGLLAAGYILHARLKPNVINITASVAALLTFVRGALAASGEGSSPRPP